MKPGDETSLGDPETLQQRLGTAVIGKSLHLFNRITSTNDYLKSLARAGAVTGTVVWANEQTRGRGRLGRTWHSPPGQGLWFSFLMRPAIPAEQLGMISLAIAAIVAEVLAEASGASLEVKWPNDVLHDGRKLCGILCEAQMSQDRIEHVVCGTGINFSLESDNSAAWRQHSTSLLAASGKHLRFDTVFLALMRALDAALFGDLTAVLPALRAKWCALCGDLGKPVTVTSTTATAPQVWEGRFIDLGPNGELQLQLPAGNIRSFQSGEITLRRGG